jgi:hypothetical protein
VIEQIASNLSKTTAGKTDEIIRAAILKETGATELILADVARHGVRKLLPDGRDIFAYKGVDLVCFWPLEIENGRNGDAYTLTVTRKYQLLSQ